MGFFETQEQLNFNACQLLLMTIGKESKKLDLEVKTDFPNVEWSKIANFRNRIAHDYRGIDYQQTFDIIKKNLPELKLTLMEIFKRIDKTDDLLAAALESEFYKHVQYLREIQ